MGMNNRRKLVIALGAGALAWAGAVRGQAPSTVRRIGLFSQTSPSVNAPSYQAFRLGLRDLGWIEGKNISIEYRYAEGRHDRLLGLAADLVRLKVDVIVTFATSDTLAAKKATSSIPIVMAGGADPVASGLVESLARSGGNVTGLSQMIVELAGKRLELLKEVIPKLCRVAVLWNPLSVSDIRLERNPTTSTAARNPASFPGSAELQRFRPSARRRNQGGRRRSCHPGRPGDRCEYKTDSGSCGQEPPAIDISRFHVRGSWRSSDLWRPPSRLVPPRRHLRGQDPEGRETRQSAD